MGRFDCTCSLYFFLVPARRKKTGRTVKRVFLREIIVYCTPYWLTLIVDLSFN
jgi:hypothetical protein